ncbi:MAG: GH25 family lysozyme [Eubacterium sp.]
MKFFKKIATILLTVLMMTQFPITAYASQKTGCIFNTKTYTHQTKFDSAEITQGVDISYHNDTVDFKKVKNAGVDFVILRVGYRGYGSSGSLNADKNFTTYIKDAQSAGLPVGVYFYSQAITTAEARDEANYVLGKIKSYDIQLPVVFDYEFADVSTGRLDSAWSSGKLNKTKMTAIAMEFCATVEKAGYDAMVYANKSFFTNQLDHTKIEQEYGIWLAHYTTNTTYSGDYNIWQFSSTGKVSGVSGDVDCNFMYTFKQDKLEVEDIAAKAYTGSAIEPSPAVTSDGKKLVKNTDYTVTYKNNIEIGKASLTIKGKGDYAGHTKTVNFNIVPVKSAGMEMTSRGTDSVSLKWDKTPQATGYRIQVYRSNGWQIAGYTTGTTFTVKDLSSASNYSFRVRAYKTVNGVNYYGAYSSAIKHATKPAKVTELKATSSSTTSVTLSWKRQAGATRYQVYKYSATKKQYVLYKELTSANSTSLKVTSLKPNTPYGFKVRAIKDAAEGVTLIGEFSSILKTATKPEAPKIKAASSPSSKKIKVTYSKVSCNGYQIRWSTTKDFSSNNKSVYVTSPSSLTKTVTTAQAKKTYYVKVRAYRNVNGTKLYSSWSDTLKVVTK